ncbi:MAG: GNAT family N-acetyltransferase [Candidatus Eisenbacteria bacterium]|jgi:RimJ/RimL family protein N-acetyltransferase|nr:GNAT family N-acetyltransferase [Candidatus Eisenbacteria bacterium]
MRPSSPDANHGRDAHVDRPLQSGRVALRPTTEDDLAAFFAHQLDPEANRMAAFTAKDPADLGAFLALWGRILRDDAITKWTIISDGRVAGHIVGFQQFGKPSVCYWLGREYWGRGIATEALMQFLRHVTIRPLYARAAKDNIGSLRVLEKCGFKVSGESKGFSIARGVEVEEYILELTG